MKLLNIINGCLSFSDLKILDNINLNLYKKEKICLMGKNGAGKSTLFNVIAKKIFLDNGYIEFKKNIKINYLKQSLPKRSSETIYNFICKNIKKNSDILIRYDKEKNIQKKNDIKEILKKKNLWETYIQINKTLQKMFLDKNQKLNSLSGGWLRKISIIRSLIQNPEILLLDEPTNHLDINSIKWIEKYLKKFTGGLLFISHDRQFINNISTKIIDLDRGKLRYWSSNTYEKFIEEKKMFLQEEELKNKKFDNKLKKEILWSKKGIKARRTRNEGRLKKIKNMNFIQSNRIEIPKKYPLIINQIKNLNTINFKLKNIFLSINKKKIIKNFSYTIRKGDRIALIGPNGCGKSSFLKLLVKEIKPNKGTINYGEKIKIEYFDQEKNQINLNNSIIENLSYGKNTTEINGKTYSLLGILKKFLFSSEKINSSTKILSGGEINRLLLIKLLLKPSNVLILDEPTNDLDLDMLEFLEKLLQEYHGTIILVSHDRQFVNNATNTFFIFNSNGEIDVNTGNFLDYCKKKDLKKITKIKEKKKHSLQKKINKNKRKINEINKKILDIEKKIKNIYIKINEVGFYKKENKEIKNIFIKLNNYKIELEKKIEQWEILES